jgi:hypothetical protein
MRKRKFALLTADPVVLHDGCVSTPYGVVAQTD